MLEGFKVEDFLSGDGSFEALPSGWYRARVGDLKAYETPDVAPIGWRKNRNGSGYHLSLTFVVAGVHRNDKGETGEKYVGRNIFSNLNIQHTNPEAVRMAKMDLAKIVNACGLAGLERGAEDLVGKELLIRLKFVPETASTDSDNKLVGFKSLPPVEIPTIAAPAPVNGGSRPKWEAAQVPVAVAETAPASSFNF